MGRLRVDFLSRVECFVDRVMDVVDVLASQQRSRRILDQLTGSATSVGANTFEADEALSRADFCKTLGIVIKELNETRFWLRLCVRRQWIIETRLIALQSEADELKLIFGTMLSKSRLRLQPAASSTQPHSQATSRSPDPCRSS